MTPIVLTTYNRPEYFQNTINNLELTDCDLKHLYIFDDCSDNPRKKELLNKYKEKYNVFVSDKNKGTVLNTIPNIEYVFNIYNSEHIVLLQDDIELNKNWLTKGIEILKKINSKYKNIALLSLYNRKDMSSDEYYIMEHGHQGGVAWIINGSYWKIYRTIINEDEYMTSLLTNNDKRLEHSIRNYVDWKFCNIAHRSGYHIAYVGKSLVQHVGDNSTLSNKSMAFCRTKNFVGK